MFNDYLAHNDPAGLLKVFSRTALKRARRLLGGDEVTQLGRIALWRSVLKYDPSRASLKTLLTLEVRTLMFRALQEYDQKPPIQRRIGLGTACKKRGPVEAAVENEIGESVLAAVERLRPKQSQAVCGLMAGQSMRDIGKSIGVTPQAISLRVTSAMAELSKTLKHYQQEVYW